MNGLENAFIPWQPRPPASVEKQSFFFVTYTGDPVSKNKAARKTIRAQASRASASQRIETTALRRGTHRSQSNSPSKRSRLSNPRAQQLLLDYATDVLSESTRLQVAPYSQVAFQPPVTGDHILEDSTWECALPTLIRENYVKAVLEMRRQQIGCDLRQLSMYFSLPQLYLGPLMTMTLELLSISSMSLPGIRPGTARPITVWLWQRLNEDVRAALAKSDSTWYLAPVLTLLAGWELKFGETKFCDFHLRALSRRVYGDCDPSCSINLPEEAYTYCLPVHNNDTEYDYMQPVPSGGFLFFKAQKLLPSTLMNIASSFQCDPYEYDPYVPRHTHQRRVGLAAIACQPSSQAAIQSVRNNEIEARIANHVRLASAMLSTMTYLDDAPMLPDPMIDPMTIWYPETTALDSETLMSTVYDEILLWSTCIFCCAALYHPTPPQQKGLVQSLTKSMSLHDWESLLVVLNKYGWNESITCRLHAVLGNDLFSSLA